jgi:ketosteroid isomerase-like protein
MTMRIHCLAIGVLCVVTAMPALAQTPAPAPLPSITLPAALDKVLRDYETAWRGDASAVARLFATDGFVLSSGKPPGRGRDAIAAAYTGMTGGQLKLRALAYATADTVGYILGAYTYGDAPGDMGKFTLTLRRARGQPWQIFSDMDNGNSRRP